MSAVRTRLFILLLPLLLWGCSSTFLYNQLDWLIPWYVDDYVDLSREQKKDFKAGLLPLLEWHRKEELQRYLELLDTIEQDLQGPVTEATLQRWSELFLEAYERLEQQTLPLLFATGEAMSEEQMAQFMDNLYKEQEKLEGKYLERTDEEFRQQSYENLADNMKDFLGRLSPEQKTVLREGADELQRFDAGWLEERRRWLDVLAGILLQREPDWEQQVRDAIAAREASQSQAYVDAYTYNQGVINRAIAGALALRSDKQQARLNREIQGIRKDLQALIETADD